MDDGRVTCPQKRKVVSRRSEQHLWRTHKPWKALIEAHCRVPEAFCVHCGKKHGDLRRNGKKVVLTINHLSRRLYQNEEIYCTWNPYQMEICCTICNWMYEKGKKPCPLCHDSYVHWTEDMCQGCYDKYHPLEAESRKIKQEMRIRERKKIRKALDKKAREKFKSCSKRKPAKP
jgi:hypothetical protein